MLCHKQNQLSVSPNLTKRRKPNLSQSHPRYPSLRLCRTSSRDSQGPVCHSAVSSLRFPKTVAFRNSSPAQPHNKTATPITLAFSHSPLPPIDTNPSPDSQKATAYHLSRSKVSSEKPSSRPNESYNIRRRQCFRADRNSSSRDPNWRG